MMNEMLGNMLLQLITEHKKDCDKEDCGINTFLFHDLLKSLFGRSLTQEEIGKIM